MLFTGDIPAASTNAAMLVGLRFIKPALWSPGPKHQVWPSINVSGGLRPIVGYRKGSKQAVNTLCGDVMPQSAVAPAAGKWLYVSRASQALCLF
ncbi:hypothetical protein FKM82_027316 [Ascaphus truei]